MVEVEADEEVKARGSVPPPALPCRTREYIWLERARKQSLGQAKNVISSEMTQYMVVVVEL